MPSSTLSRTALGTYDLKYLSGRKLDKEIGVQVSSLKLYKKNLYDIVAYLQKGWPNANLTFATTTPVPQGAAGRIVGDAKKYNAAALDVLGAYPEITINDLYAFTKRNHAKWWIESENVHYSETGKNAQGDEVARQLMICTH